MRRHFAIFIFVLLPTIASAYDLSEPTIWFDLPKSERLERLTREFSAYANFYAANRGYRFGRGAQAFFDDKSARQAATAVMGKQQRYFERARRKIRGNFRLFIDRMIEESKTIPGYSKRHPGVIGEETLSAALSSVCPLWPICE